MRSYFGTSIKEIGAMGVGMYLYFWVIRIVGIVFAFCTLLSLPALILNHEVSGLPFMFFSKHPRDHGIVVFSFKVLLFGLFVLCKTRNEKG